MTGSAVTAYFTHWRQLTFGSREILEGLVAEAHGDPSSDLARAIAGWDGYHYWNDTAEGRWLVLVRERARPRARYWLHGLLLLLTLLTTSLAGASLLGGGDAFFALPSRATLAAGMPFSIPLLAILCAHESGHYLAARRYRIDASLPFFIPFPHQLNLLGTLGAFIRLRSPIFDRRTLLDVGAAGPIAGLALALPVLAVGLMLSGADPQAPRIALAHQFFRAGDAYVFLGDSPLLLLLRAAVGPVGVLHLHPAAVAGWVGVFVTLLNLLPLAQLDGGHISFALLERRHIWLARGVWIVLLGLGWWLWPGWWLWAAVGLVLGRGRLAHPRVVAPRRDVRGARRVLGWLMLALLILCFSPLPFALP